VKTNSRSVLINLSLFLFSTLFALLLSEMALRLTGFETLYVSPERDRFWKYDPLLGWAHEPGYEGVFETEQFRTTVHINEKGLRDRSHSYEREGDTQRILVLGDSFAWGYGVEESERFSQLLEADPGVKVINAGVSGYSTDQELLWYENEGIKYETDLVILVLTGNDVGDNNRQLVNHIYFKPRFVFKDGQLVPTGHPVPQSSSQGKFIYSLSQRSALVYFLTLRYFDLQAIYGRMKTNSDQPSTTTPANKSETDPFKLTIALIDEMRKIAESKNAKFMVMSTDRWWNLSSEETYQDFVAAMESDGLLVLDVESMPGFNAEVMRIPDDGHWSQSGHKFAAQQIEAFIEQHQLLSQP
jgi:lysophospholipase L1-like esterase